MYSVILMAAIASGPDTAAFGAKHASCHGCCGGVVVSYGCTGVTSCTGCYGSCTGSYSSCTGCYSSCHGCCGGGGLFHRNRASCSGCWSSCHGSCYGSCYGSWYGASYGSFYGSWSTPTYGPWFMPYSGCTGCYGGGITIISGGEYPVIPVAPAPTPAPAETPKKTGGGARLTIELPAMAKLFVDGKPTNGTAAVRQFHTPELAAGQKFFYDFRAEIEVNGVVEVEEKRVVVRAGDVLAESFPKLLAAVKASADPVASAK